MHRRRKQATCELRCSQRTTVSALQCVCFLPITWYALPLSRRPRCDLKHKCAFMRVWAPMARHPINTMRSARRLEAGQRWASRSSARSTPSAGCSCICNGCWTQKGCGVAATTTARTTTRFCALSFDAAALRCPTTGSARPANPNRRWRRQSLAATTEAGVARAVMR